MYIPKIVHKELYIWYKGTESGCVYVSGDVRGVVGYRDAAVSKRDVYERKREIHLLSRKLI